jgi:FtsZ-binding cell division protein ZapB
VPLKLSQIHLGPEIKLSGGLTPALLFMKDGVVKLRERIKELQEEKANIRKQHHELKKQHVTLNKGKTEKQAKVRCTVS